MFTGHAEIRMHAEAAEDPSLLRCGCTKAPFSAVRGSARTASSVNSFPSRSRSDNLRQRVEAWVRYFR